jgi:arginine decarboxylase
MKNTYFQLINQTYYFPQEGFDLNEDYLTFHNYSLKYLIEKYGTPLRITFLPRIGDQIKKAKNNFNRAIKANNYKGEYHYCYCTKCCHFNHVITEALKHGVHLETSSAFDIDLIRKLFETGKISKKTFLIHNGHKTDDYIEKIAGLIKDDFTNVIPILDSKAEIDRLLKATGKGTLNVGLRMAINEEPQSAYYTSRLGIRSADIVEYYKNVLSKKKRVKVKMLHFFVDSGIRDTLYYWGEFRKALKTFAELKKECPSLDSINLGGGFPIRNNLAFEYDYKYMIDEIVRTIKEVCEEEGIDEPNIFTEFGKYSVGESGAIVFSVLEQKQQNDAELWYLIDNSLMNTIPDAWSINERFILLPINKWQNEYKQVNIGGISCDHSDYYNSEDLDQQVFLPTYKDGDKEPLYLGFFHTGAYQEAISGYGGIKHCLIPSPKHIIIDRDEKGNYTDRVYRDEQTVEQMLSILGYS